MSVDGDSMDFLKQGQSKDGSDLSLKAFLVKVFQGENVMSIADARLKIEEDFEHNFKPDRDLIDFLQSK